MGHFAQMVGIEPDGAISEPLEKRSKSDLIDLIGRLACLIAQQGRIIGALRSAANVPPPSASLQPSETQEDTKRLDWLDSDAGYGCMNHAIFGRYSTKRPSVREAIDFNMASSMTAHKQEEKTKP